MSARLVKSPRAAMSVHSSPRAASRLLAGSSPRASLPAMPPALAPHPLDRSAPEPTIEQRLFRLALILIGVGGALWLIILFWLYAWWTL